MKRVRRASALAFALLMTLIPAAPSVAATGDPVLLNEVLASHTGTDDTEFIELFGTPGASLDGISVIVVESDVASNGSIDRRIDFGPGDVLGSNGFYLIGNPSGLAANYGVTPNATIGDDFLENSSATYALVQTSSITGSNVSGSEVVLDAVAATDGDAGDSFFFSAPVIGPDGSFFPAGVRRVTDGVDTDTASDWVISDFGLGTANTPTAGTDIGGLAECDETLPITLISDVQGDGFRSPLRGTTLTVEGSVTGVFPALAGITIQEELEDRDDSSTSSEGVFVYVGALDLGLVDVSDLVQVTGEVFEQFGNTQLGREGDPDDGIPDSASSVAVCDADPVEIAPTPLTLPATFAEREALEGMLVVTTQDLTVTSLFTAYRFGELGVAPGDVLRQPTDVYEPGTAAAFDLADANADALLFIDDRGEFGNDNDPWFGAADQRAGDIVEAGVAGVLYYSFGDHLLEPVGDFPEIVDGTPVFADREPAPALDGGNDIGAFNVLNYFNTFGDSDVLRGAQSQEEFDLQSSKIVEAIIQMDAAVLGLVEIENDYEDAFDGDPDTEPSIVTLVDQLNAVAGPGTYAYVEVPEALLTDDGLGGGGLGPDAIAVAIVYQPARATEVGEAATFDIDALLGGEDTDNNRWPLAQSFEIDGQVVTVVVNHFKSKGSTCDDTVVPAGFGDGEDDPLTSNCDLVREYAAERMIEWVRIKPTGVTSPDTFLVGDFNSYAEEDPIRIFEAAGYEDLVESYDGGAFTYKFDGRYGRLDYIIASPSAKRLVNDAEVWQLNSPEPYGYLYSNDPIDATAYASSDHDAVLASISKPGKGPKK